VVRTVGSGKTGVQRKKLEYLGVSKLYLRNKQLKKRNRQVMIIKELERLFIFGLYNNTTVELTSPFQAMS
jgi:hypothetical protein